MQKHRFFSEKHNLNQACLAHNFEHVSRILNYQNILARSVDANKRTPLHYLCNINSSPVYLGDSSARVNSALQPNQIAFIENFTEILNLLMVHNLDINAETDIGQETAFLICCGNGDQDKQVATLLMEAVLLLTGKLDIYRYFRDDIDKNLSFRENIESLFLELLSDVGGMIVNLLNYYSAETSSDTPTLAKWLLRPNNANAEAIVASAVKCCSSQPELPSSSDVSFSAGL